MFGLYFSGADDIVTFADVMASDAERFKRFFHLMLDGGVYLAPSAYEAGFTSIAHGETELALTLDAAERATRALEDNPVFDAGQGSFVNSGGHVELDAIIMNGETLRTGAVAALQNVANPISVARLVMERTPHNLLVGDGARQRSAPGPRLTVSRGPGPSTSRHWAAPVHPAGPRSGAGC